MAMEEKNETLTVKTDNPDVRFGKDLQPINGRR
ncbi:Uncharacterised protein [uncultured archaeon]|nr:Uncharacterised protein [uncultured archaeon]